jgi:hypothetical protein
MDSWKSYRGGTGKDVASAYGLRPRKGTVRCPCISRRDTQLSRAQAVDLLARVEGTEGWIPKVSGVG